MSKLECKYKFQDAEKFECKPYCTLFNELCKDLSFVCDKNCQVYEDYKQLEELKAENLGFKILHESDKDLLKHKEQECEALKRYLNKIRDEELSHLDIEWDEYETSARQDNYSNIITLVERALGEIDD